MDKESIIMCVVGVFLVAFSVFIITWEQTAIRSQKAHDEDYKLTCEKTDLYYFDNGRKPIYRCGK